MLKPYYSDGSCVIYHGDCRQVMPRLGNTDHVMTDPPYEAEAHTLQRRVLGRGPEEGRRDILDSALPFASISDEGRDETAKLMVAISTGWVLVFCQAEAVWLWRRSLESAGAKWRRAMAWVKPDGMPQFSGDRPGMGYESMALAWAGTGGSRWNGGGRHGVYIVPKHDGGMGHGGTANEHPTTKPSRLMNDLMLDFTRSGELVLDPFMGSGTTLVAAKRLGRKAIGIELEEKYCEIAAERLAQGALDLFGEASA